MAKKTKKKKTSAARKKNREAQTATETPSGIAAIKSYSQLTDKQFESHCRTSVEYLGWPRCVERTASNIEAHAHQLIKARQRDDSEAIQLFRAFIAYAGRRTQVYINWLRQRNDHDALMMLPHTKATVENPGYDDGLQVPLSRWEKVVDELRAVALYLERKAEDDDRYAGLNYTDRAIAELLDRSDKPMTAGEIAGEIPQAENTVRGRLKNDKPLRERGLITRPDGGQQGYVASRKRGA